MLPMNFATFLAGLILTSTAFGAGSDRVPVLLELFTSEGCSSCPPADQLLEKLDHDQPIAGAKLIVLSEHVDYWNRLGWTDPYSSSQFSRRQEAYAAQLHTDDIYTPQLVVDGNTQVVGSNWPMAARAIQSALREPKIAMKIRIEKTAQGALVHLEVPARPSNDEKTVVYLAIAANHAKSHVTRGENGGRELMHVAVVLSLEQIGKISAKDGFTKDVPVASDAKLDVKDLRVVAFVQDARTRHILGAAQAYFSD